MDFLTTECEQFSEYWHSLPKVGLIPRRADFLPEEVASLLSNFIMHEFISPKLSTIRLVGSSIAIRYSEDIKGKNYLDFVEDNRKAQAGAALQKMSEQPCAMRVLLRQRTSSGREYLSESLGFPLLNSRNNNRLLLFQNVVIETDFKSFEMPEQLVNLGVSARDYIDIGAGLPDELVQE